MTALGFALAISACGAPSSQVAKDASRTGARGDAKDSLFRAANLRRALTRVGPAGPVASFKLEAGALTLVTQRGPASESVAVTKRLDLTRVSAPAAADQPPIPLAQIDPGAPERIAAAVSQRTGAGLKDIDFFAVDREPGASAPRWLVYLRRGRGTFAASLSGADLQPVSAATTTTSPATSPSATTSTPTTPTPPTSPPAPPTAPGTASPAPPQRRPPNCLRLRPQERLRIPACAGPTAR